VGERSTFFIPVKAWEPGSPGRGIGYLSECKNLIWYDGFLHAISAPLDPSSSPYSGAVSGMFEHVYSGDVVGWEQDRLAIYVGTTTKLYEGTTDRTRAVGGAYSATGWPWSFVSWGNKVIAANHTDEIQIATPGSAFADIYDAASPAKPRAKFVEILGEHVILLNCALDSSFSALASGNHPQLVWWSKTDDETLWSDPTQDASWNSDYQQLSEIDGQITGCEKVGDDALIIFTTQGAYLMSRTGDEFLFRFQSLFVGERFGCQEQELMTSIGRTVYFVNPFGELMVSRGLSEPVRVEGSFHRLLTSFDEQQNVAGNDFKYAPGEDIQENYDVTTWRPGFLVFDPSSEVLFWLYQSTPSGSGNQRDHILAYNTVDGKSSLIDLGYESLTWNAACTRSALGGALIRYYQRIPKGLQFVVTDGSSNQISTGFYERATGSMEWKIVTHPFNLNPVEPTQLGVGSEGGSIYRIKPIYRNWKAPSAAAHYPYIKISSADSDSMAASVSKTMDTTVNAYLLDDQEWYTVTGGKIVGQSFTIEMGHAAQADSDNSLRELAGFLVDASTDSDKGRVA
jgi:hypothetical protein